MTSGTKHERSAGSRTADIVVTSILGMLLLLISIVLTVFGLLAQLNADVCAPPVHPCNFPLLAATMFITPVVALAAIGVTITGIIIRARRNKPTWWVPLVGIGVVIVAFVITAVLNTAAIGPI